MFSKTRCFVLITGASRGLGRSIGVALADEVGDGSTFLLLSRSKKDLEETKNILEEKFLAKKLQVIVKSVDNETADRGVFEACLDEALSGQEDVNSFDVAVAVHNAGSLGPQGTSVRDSFDQSEMKNYFSTNLFSVMMLNSAFMARFPPSSTRLIVNISSLAALQPFDTWSFYCMGKSARDMLFRVMAAEEKDDKHLRIVNYAPGPLDTAMVADVMSSSSTNPGILESFTKMKSEGQLLSPDESAKKLMKILNLNEFKNGDHVDFFDVQ